uniref:Small ribosomal subunit protein uS3c n=1 Tax=Hickelia madagascariensis TaxID=104003 RepID=A0A0F6NNU5_9POAL|nr:ribosomal protein S3 [Hickelia madagascariensis]AIM53403.1 ribosomal protein S3 [Hickelia madagascariensis]
MGQKINPLGFRLGTTQNHHSFWFAQPKNYSEGLQEDKKIRNCIKNYIQKNRKKGSNRKIESDSSSEVITHNRKMDSGSSSEVITHNRKMDSGSSSEVITHIEIKKQIDTIHVIIHIGFPNFLKKKGAIEELEKDLQKEINSVNQRLNIAIEKVKEPYRQPNILAEYIAFQLKNRVSFRKAMKKAVELTKKADIRGVKVQIAGRLAGKEIARVECIKKGRLPLQTIRAKIDYCCYPIRTIYGVLGVKIWIFVDEE